MIDLREDDLGVLQRVENEAMEILRATGFAPPSYPLPPKKNIKNPVFFSTIKSF